MCVQEFACKNKIKLVFIFIGCTLPYKKAKIIWEHSPVTTLIVKHIERQELELNGTLLFKMEIEMHLNGNVKECITL